MVLEKLDHRVLLETVAQVPDESPQSAETRSAAEGRDFGGDESQEFLALVKDLRDAAWHDESLVEEARRDFHQGPLGEHALSGYGSITCRNALCGPACGVLWGLGEKNPRLPDSRQIVTRNASVPEPSRAYGTMYSPPPSKWPSFSRRVTQFRDTAQSRTLSYRIILFGDDFSTFSYSHVILTFMERRKSNL